MIKKGSFVEGILFIASLVLCVVAAFTYLKRDDTEAKKFTEMAKDLKGSISALEANQMESNKQLRDLFAGYGSIVNDLNHRVKQLEERVERDSRKSMNIHLTEPVKVEVFYKNPVGAGKGGLLDRAGIHARENQ